MALTRKMLAAMDIPAEKIDEIITAHTETVNALKDERETLRADAERLAAVEKELEDAKKTVEAYKSGDWESKYNALKSEYDGYKTDTETKAAKAAKETAYAKLLKDAGIAEKRIASILKVSDIDSIQLDKDGKIADAEDRMKSAKEEWADFIVTEGKRGAETATPPADNGAEVQKPSRAAQLVEQYRTEHYGAKEG